MARAFYSRSDSAEGQIRNSKPWSTWKVGVFALLWLSTMLVAGCSGSSTQSGSKVGGAELNVDGSSSTSSTIQSEASPIEVTTTLGDLDVRAPSAALQPESAPVQDSQPRVTSAPTTQYVPPTTRYVCVPDSSALSFLERDYRQNQNLYNAAYSDLVRRGAAASGAAVELQATRSSNTAEYERARSAINACQGAYWYFLTY